MLAVRGLVVDRSNGNIFKPDRYGFTSAARHGLQRTSIARLVRRALPARADPPLQPRYAWIDSLFALPEAVLYAVLVDYFDRRAAPGSSDYATLWHDIRECIDQAHRDGRSRPIVSADLPTTS